MYRYTKLNLENGTTKAAFFSAVRAAGLMEMRIICALENGNSDELLFAMLEKIGELQQEVEALKSQVCEP